MKLSTQIIIAFGIVFLLSFIDSSSNYLLSRKVEQNTKFLINSQEIIRNSTGLHKAIIDMQSTYRGFLVSNSNRLLMEYLKKRDLIDQLLVNQQQMVFSNPEQQKILKEIEVIHKQWVASSNTVLQIMGARLEEDSSNVLSKSTQGARAHYIREDITDQIAGLFLRFDRLEYRSRDAHRSNLASGIKQARTVSLIIFILTIIVGFITVYYIVRLITTRIAGMVRLAGNISIGNFDIVEDKKRDELTKLSNSLNIMSSDLKRYIDELNKRNAELDKFAQVVSHDLKAPVRGIHNVVKWMEEDIGEHFDEKQIKYVELIRNRTKRMEDLINGLLDYARMRQKTQEIEVDVDQLVRSLVEEIVPSNFKVDLIGLPTISAEKLKLEQVFMNLISNAVKYTPNDNAQLIISCITRINDYVFEVSDNGMGIDPKYHEKIFEMFQTLRESHENESTGIGLAIVKKIIDDQLGQLWVESQLGSGTVVKFTWTKKLSL